MKVIVIPPRSVQENPSMLGRNDVAEAEALPEYFDKLFTIDDGERPTVNRNKCGLLI